MQYLQTGGQAGGLAVIRFDIFENRTLAWHMRVCVSCMHLEKASVCDLHMIICCHSCGQLPTRWIHAGVILLVNLFSTTHLGVRKCLVGG
jgi:hypothetical protein